MLRQLLLLVFIFSLFTPIYAQDSTTVEPKKKKLEIHGFVKTDFWVDSRQVIYAREGLFALFPSEIILDKNGQDINAASSFNFSAITSRVNLKINGPDAFNAKTHGFIEADFSGASNATINTFRLRHAYFQLDWKKSSLLFGQYWHPMFVTEAFPTVISLNTGSPFQPFLRSPQIRFTKYFGDFNLILAALSQRDYTSSGPLGRNYAYISNSLVPNLHAQMQYHKGLHTFGLAADIKKLRPRLVTDSNLVTNESITSYAFMAYHKWKNKNIEIKTKAIFGENMTEQLLLGGYAVSSIDTLTDNRNYTPTQHVYFWTNVIYKKQFTKFSLHPGVFIGYAKYLGTRGINNGIYYGTGMNIESMYRISPSLSIKSRSTMFSLEWEYTSVEYKSNATIIPRNDNYLVSNHRLLLTGFYFF